MHFILRPHIRGSRRVLQCIQNPSIPHSRATTRSFTSFLRLQAEHNPSAGQTPAGSNTDRKNGRDNAKVSKSTSKASNTASENEELSSNAVTANAWTGQFQRLEDEKAIVDGHLSKGEIPPGFRHINNLDDLPERFRGSLAEVELPFLFNDNPEMILRTAPTPEQFTQDPSHTPHTIEPMSRIDQNIKGQDESLISKFQMHGGELSDGQQIHVEQFIPRRDRVRNKRNNGRPWPATPEWFLKHKVCLAEHKTGNTASKSDTTKLAAEDKEATELIRQIEGATIVASTVETGAKSEGSTTSDAQDVKRGPAGAASSPPISFKNGRYFGEQSQITELLLTVRGRLRNFVKTDLDLSEGRPVDVNHLTVNHGAKGAVFLIDELIKGVASSVNGNYINLDIQDISSFFPAQSKEWHASRAASYDVYRDVYGLSKRPRFFGTMLPENQDDQDMEQDIDGQDEPRATPVFAMARLPEQFSEIGEMLSGTAKHIRAMHAQSGDVSQDAIKSAVRRLLATSEAAAIPRVEGDNAPEECAEADSPKIPAPTIFHVQNYRAILENVFGGRLLAELVNEADRRNAIGHRVMIVGTDYARDEPLESSPNSILEEQDRRSFGASSNILLTPCFPESKDERHLLEDRELHIKQINARHLWDALPKHKDESQSRFTFAGLGDGFWLNLKDSLSKEDYEALGTEFWDRIRVQRIAALASAHEGSASPVGRAADALAKSDDSKVEWARRSQPDTFKFPDVATEAVSETFTKLSKIRKGASRHEKRLLHGVVEPTRIATTFNDIHIPAETISALKTLTTLSLIRPDAFTYGVLKSDRIPGLLLYGPPGTGKTLAAKAVARESGATMLEVSGADLNDMFVGEGEKNVQALFSLARKLSPCVVFLDEADAMFSARGGEGGGRRSNHRELLNQFLREWDGMSNDSGSAFLMVATNRPMDLDDAVLRRLPRRILVDLPTELDRLQILKIHLRNEQLASDVDLNDLAAKTPFYSGSDLKNVAVAAALEAVKEENEAKKKHDEINSEAEQYKYPERRTLTQAHFAKALEEISASISEDMSSLRDIRRFDEQYGDKRARKRRRSGWGFKSKKEINETGRETVKVRS